MLARIALVLSLLLAPQLAAQDIPFPGGGGYVWSQYTIPMTWQGKPALLVMGAPGTYVGVRYDAQCPPVQPRETPWFTLAGALAYDTRTCAPGARVFLVDGDYVLRGEFRPIGANGISEWMGAIRVAFDKQYTRIDPKRYQVNYCSPGWANGPCGPCDAPEFVAMLLVYEGLSW